jgi:hypothetical protein
MGEVAFDTVNVFHVCGALRAGFAVLPFLGITREGPGSGGEGSAAGFPL